MAGLASAMFLASVYRMQFCNKPVDALCDILPIRQPVSRETKGDVGVADASLEEADTGIGYALARAAGKKMLGRV